MKVLSLGMGKQSTALYVLSSLGLIPKVDVAIFSDLGHEGEATYEFINKWFLPWAEKNSDIQIVITESDKGALLDSLNTNRIMIPAYTMSNEDIGMIKRQCTNDYKIIPLNKEIKKLMGISHYGRYEPFELWLGINIHEWDRMREPQLSACTNVYPFTGYWFKKDSYGKLDWKADYPDNKLPALFESVGLPTPPPSSCVFCPFNSPSRWKKRLANERDRAVIVEAQRRLQETTKDTKGKRLSLFRYDVSVDEFEAMLNETNGQMSLFEDNFDECGGHCGS